MRVRVGARISKDEVAHSRRQGKGTEVLHSGQLSGRMNEGRERACRWGMVASW